MIAAATSVTTAPIMEMNTTPLIDVLLVLLIMFIITIPIQTHAVKLDLPTPCVYCRSQSSPIRNHLVGHRGQARSCGTGQPCRRSSSRQLWQGRSDDGRQPELHLQPEPDARYELVDEVLALTKRSRITRLGFVGNERYAAR